MGSMVLPNVALPSARTWASWNSCMMIMLYEPHLDTNCCDTLSRSLLIIPGDLPNVEMPGFLRSVGVI